MAGTVERKVKVKTRSPEGEMLYEAKGNLESNTLWVRIDEAAKTLEVDVTQISEWLLRAPSARLARKLSLYYPACKDGVKRVYIPSVSPHVTLIKALRVRT